MSPEINRGPVSPSEAGELQTQQIPEEVFEVFNGLIARNLSEGRSKVLQCEVLKQLAAKEIKPSTVYENRWLDVEDSYRAAGWSVTYSRPIYWGGEDFEPYFEFKAKRKHQS